MARFSKEAMIEALEKKASYLKDTYNFDPGNGTAQLKNRDQDTAVAYGRFRLCLDLIDAIENGRIAK